MYLIVTFLTMLVFTQAKTYHGYEQPDYTLARDQPQDKSFEARIYSAANWTSTVATGKSMDSSDMFMELFDYIRGDNKEKTKIDMTVPVTIMFKSQSCIYCDHTYVMSFYLPKAFQSSAPTPMKASVYTERRNKMKVYVRTFSGFPHQCDYEANAKLLYSDLIRNGVTEDMMVPNMFYGASYNSPFKIFGRRNEVWILASK